MMYFEVAFILLTFLGFSRKKLFVEINSVPYFRTLFYFFIIRKCQASMVEPYEGTESDPTEFESLVFRQELPREKKTFSHKPMFIVLSVEETFQQFFNTVYVYLKSFNYPKNVVRTKLKRNWVYTYHNLKTISVLFTSMFSSLS